jgi:predicted nucleic acid-binding protein
MASASRSNRRRYVLDANALTGFFEDRRLVAEKVRHVFYVSWRRHGEAKAREAEATLRELPITVVAVDRERATRAGALKEKHGLGYADALAAELAIERGAWLVTADPVFSKVGKGLSIYSLPRYEK